MSEWKLEPYVDESDRATAGGPDDCTGSEDEESEDGEQ